jgi:GntR family transcriptional regulator/MocR family aminotransferase
MAQGRYEQHINRMRNRYRQKRDAVIDAIRTGPLAGRAEIMEQDAGLHFLLRLDTQLSDEALRRAAAGKGIRLALLSDYYYHKNAAPQHVVVVNYSGIELDALRDGLVRLAELWED